MSNIWTEYRNFAAKLLGWIPDKYPVIIKTVEPSLLKSGMGITPKSYISAVCLTSLISYIATLILFSVLVFIVWELKISLTILLIVFMPVLVTTITFIVGLFYPQQLVMSRRKSIETNLPFIILHMASIVSSGIPPQAVFKLLSEFEEYDVLADEMKKITRNIDVFGLDPMTALREVAKRTPSEKFKQLLQGLITTIEGGGDLKTYLKSAGEQSLFNWGIKRQKYLDQLSTYAEFYTGILIASPLFLVSLFSVMNMIQPQLGGFQISQLMQLSVYVIIPALNIGFLFFLHMTQVEI